MLGLLNCSYSLFTCAILTVKDVKVVQYVAFPKTHHVYVYVYVYGLRLATSTKMTARSDVRTWPSRAVMSAVLPQLKRPAMPTNTP